MRWAEQLRRQGSLARAPLRPYSRVPGIVLQRVRRTSQRQPRLSIRQICRRTGASRSTVQRILRQGLRFRAFKLQVLHQQKRGDKAKRLQFCKWLLRKWDASSFRKHFIMSDEAHFYLSGAVNKQNCRVWGEENPHATLERETQGAYATVWCGVAEWGIIGPYFFEQGSRRVTITVLATVR